MAEQRSYLTIRQENLLLWTSFGIITLIAFEALAVSTAMPTVVEALHGRSMYALAMGISMTAQLITASLAGPWADSLGPRSCLFTGLVVFSGGLLLASAAPSMPIFVIGRAIQGLGGGLCIVPLYTIIGSSVQPAHQPRFFAAFAAAWVLPALIGPAVSGFVVVRWSWRWIFAVVPIIIILSSPFIARVTGSVAPTPKPLDWPGLHRKMAPATIAGIAVAVLQVVSGQDASTYRPLTYGVLALAGVIAIAAMRRLLPVGTFLVRRGLASTVFLRGALNAAFLGTETYLPLMLKENHGWSPFQAGLVLTVGSVTWAVGSWLQGRITQRVWRDRLPLIGASVEFAGLIIVLLPAFPHISGLLTIVGWLVAGLGCGIAYPYMSVHALALTPLERKGETSSALQLADTFGTAFAVALTGIAFALFQGSQSAPFVAAIGLMVALQGVAIIVSRRIVPPANSAEAHQLERTYALESESESDE